MAGIFEKLRLIGLSNIHAALDRVIDLNSPAAVEQLIRDLKRDTQIVDDGVAASENRWRELTKAQRTKTTRVTQLNTVITQILTDDDPTNDAAAKPKMREKLALEADLQKLSGDLETEAQAKGTLEEALTLIRGRTSELEARLEQLRSTEKQAAAKEEAVSALRTAREALDKGPGSSVDSALQRAEKRGGVAGVQLERELGKLRDTTGAASVDVEVDAALATFKAQLKSKPQTASSGS